MKNQNEIRTVYLLESVDLEKSSGVLKIKPETPANAPWRTIKVALSPLLRHRIMKSDHRGLSKEQGQKFVGTRFCSTVTSREFSENPFNLREFVPTEESDIPLNYRLHLVMESYTPRQEVMDALGRTVKVHRGFRKELHPSKWLRYQKILTSAKMADFNDDSLIVLPE